MEKSNINIYKGKGLKLRKYKQKCKKIFVFDLDETIGHFSEIYRLFQFIEIMETKYKQNFFNNEKECLFYLLDLFPEVFRYGIDIIFSYLYKKNNENQLTYVYIYTNNICIPITWTTYISEYIENKWNLPNLFTNIVRAFKINGKIVENKRSTGEKTYNDFLHCVQLPKDTSLCFIDNTEYVQMKHNYVYYLQPKPFFIDLSVFQIIDRFVQDFQSKCNNIMNIQEEIYNYYKEKDYVITNSNKSDEDKLIDINITKKILYCVQKFYKYKLVKIHTRKKRHISNNKTKKNNYKLSFNCKINNS